MAIILEKGEAHKAHIWKTECDLCGSKLQLFEDLDDPAVAEFGSAGTNTVYISYICPVCGESQRAYAHEFDCYSTNPNQITIASHREHAISHGTRREYRALTKEERVELQNYPRKAEEEAPDNEPFFIE